MPIKKFYFNNINDIYVNNLALNSLFLYFYSINKEARIIGDDFKI